MKGFVKVLIWIVVLAAICVGVYFVLPEYPQSMVKSIFQPMVDSEAKSMISQVQSLTNKDLDNASYKTILEAKTKNPCWVYNKDETTGEQSVVFYGRGISINLKDWTDYEGVLSTSASIKMEFKISGRNVEILPYVDGKLMSIKDGAHVDQNDKIKLDILSQMYTGMQTEK